MFTNILYFPFLIFSAFVYWLIPKQRLRTAWLALCSLAFISYLDIHALLVVCGLTIFTYMIAIWIESGINRKLAHRTGIIGLICVLGIFKYIGFLAGTLNSLMNFMHQLPVFSIEKLFLPLGISYIVFKYISYLTDIYWGLIKRGKFLDFICYGSLYTIFVAGPIERFENLKPQFEAVASRFRTDDLAYAFMRIVFGLFKKLVLADWIGFFIHPVFQNNSTYPLGIKILAILGYSLQIYFDFAGYSDIAIGSSRLFGLRIMENFDNPYLSTSITQFWRKWHISLSDWIRNYLFFPLSQNRSNKIWLTICVPIIAMAICGLWHGSAWHYVIWGIWHGSGIAIYQQWSQLKRKYKSLSRLTKTPWFKTASIICTFIFVTVGWMWFK